MFTKLHASIKARQIDLLSTVQTALTYLLLYACVGGAFISVILAYYRFMPAQPFYGVVLLLFCTAVLLVLVSDHLKLTFQKRLDRLFYGSNYLYREALLNFAGKIGSILNMNELANEMLPTLSNALRAKRARLLTVDERGDFSVKFIYPASDEERDSQLRIAADSHLMFWLGKENTPLDLTSKRGLQLVEGLPESERNVLLAHKIAALCPVKSRGRLVGALVMDGRRSGDRYSQRDLRTIMAVTGQVGPMIENAQLYSQAVSLAISDGLTGLYNHRHFHRLVDQEIARCSRYGSAFSLIMLDIDFFKAYNDTFGHLAGDKVLREVGELVRRSIRDADTAFRYGGEEFTIILPETQPRNAFIVAERIRERLENMTGAGEMTVTASFGIAGWPADGATKEEMIANADTALYFAKRTGRNKTCLFCDVPKSQPLPDPELKNRMETANTVYALAAAIDAKDHYTYGHSRKVSELAVGIAESLGLSSARMSSIRAGALLHDVGKIGIPDSILTKDGALTADEWEITRLHPRRGVEILRQVADLNDCLPAVLHHHERWDGKGYPFGLQGENIPLEARILAIADSYDALTSKRRYREQLPQDKALEEIRRCSGTQFDPDLVNIFSRILQETSARVQFEELEAAAII